MSESQNFTRNMPRKIIPCYVIITQQDWSIVRRQLSSHDTWHGSIFGVVFDINCGVGWCKLWISSYPCVPPVSKFLQFFPISGGRSTPCSVPFRAWWGMGRRDTDGHISTRVSKCVGKVLMIFVLWVEYVGVEDVGISIVENNTIRRHLNISKNKYLILRKLHFKFSFLQFVNLC